VLVLKIERSLALLLLVQLVQVGKLLPLQHQVRLRQDLIHLLLVLLLQLFFGGFLLLLELLKRLLLNSFLLLADVLSVLLLLHPVPSIKSFFQSTVQLMLLLLLLVVHHVLNVVETAFVLLQKTFLLRLVQLVVLLDLPHQLVVL